jgi:hypothetical protein
MAQHATDASGVLHGKTITLDGPVPALDGRRVHVVIAAENEELTLSGHEATELWHQWLLSGEQGPISDDGEPEFP